MCRDWLLHDDAADVPDFGKSRSPVRPAASIRRRLDEQFDPLAIASLDNAAVGRIHNTATALQIRRASQGDVAIRGAQQQVSHKAHDPPDLDAELRKRWRWAHHDTSTALHRASSDDRLSPIHATANPRSRSCHGWGGAPGSRPELVHTLGRGNRADAPQRLNYSSRPAAAAATASPPTSLRQGILSTLERLNHAAANSFRTSSPPPPPSLHFPLPQSLPNAGDRSARQRIAAGSRSSATDDGFGLQPKSSAYSIALRSSAGSPAGGSMRPSATTADDALTDKVQCWLPRSRTCSNSQSGTDFISPYPGCSSIADEPLPPALSSLMKRSERLRLLSEINSCLGSSTLGPPSGAFNDNASEEMLAANPAARQSLLDDISNNLASEGGSSRATSGPTGSTCRWQGRPGSYAPDSTPPVNQPASAVGAACPAAYNPTVEHRSSPRHPASRSFGFGSSKSALGSPEMRALRPSWMFEQSQRLYGGQAPTGDAPEDSTSSGLASGKQAGGSVYAAGRFSMYDGPKWSHAWSADLAAASQAATAAAPDPASSSGLFSAYSARPETQARSRLRRLEEASDRPRGCSDAAFLTRGISPYPSSGDRTAACVRRHTTSSTPAYSDTFQPIRQYRTMYDHAANPGSHQPFMSIRQQQQQQQLAAQGAVSSTSLLHSLAANMARARRLTAPDST